MMMEGFSVLIENAVLICGTTSSLMCVVALSEPVLMPALEGSLTYSDLTQGNEEKSGFNQMPQH